jgi:hypothetical protein
MIELFWWGVALAAIGWWCVRVCKLAFWWPQKRWVVWTPERTKYWYLQEKLWTTPVDKPMAERYAKILNGKVYRIR